MEFRLEDLRIPRRLKMRSIIILITTLALSACAPAPSAEKLAETQPDAPGSPVEPVTPSQDITTATYCRDVVMTILSLGMAFKVDLATGGAELLPNGVYGWDESWGVGVHTPACHYEILGGVATEVE